VLDLVPSVGNPSGSDVDAPGHSTITVAVTGYTDSVGPDSVNNPLSQARAQAVVAALTPQVAGAPVTLQAAGKGAADPVSGEY